MGLVSAHELTYVLGYMLKHIIVALHAALYPLCSQDRASNMPKLCQFMARAGHETLLSEFALPKLAPLSLSWILFCLRYSLLTSL